MKFSRTWWGERFIKALEEFTEMGRLGRGSPMLVMVKSSPISSKMARLLPKLGVL